MAEPILEALIESLRRFHRYYGDDFTVECPVGSGQFLNLAQVSDELSRRLSRLFLKNANGRRPVFGDSPRHQHDPAFRDHVLFHEYFHGDTGRGIGAAHQTGWTGLVALRSRVASLRLRNELGPPLPEAKPTVTGTSRIAGGAS